MFVWDIPNRSKADACLVLRYAGVHIDVAVREIYFPSMRFLFPSQVQSKVSVDTLACFDVKECLSISPLFSSSESRGCGLEPGVRASPLLSMMLCSSRFAPRHVHSGYKMMILMPSFMAGRPKVAEFDYTGTIVDVGSDIPYKLGDKVWGMIDLTAAQGSLAQYILVTEDDSAIRPERLSVDQAAGLGCVGLTAQQALFKWAQVEKGQSVLIIGGPSPRVILTHRC